MERSSCKQTIASVTVLLCDYWLKTNSAQGLIQGGLQFALHPSPVYRCVVMQSSTSLKNMTLFYLKQNPLSYKEKKSQQWLSLLQLLGCRTVESQCVLIPTAVEMQMTLETAFVQQQHHCSSLRELQYYRHTTVVRRMSRYFLYCKYKEAGKQFPASLYLQWTLCCCCQTPGSQEIWNHSWLWEFFCHFDQPFYKNVNVFTVWGSGRELDYSSPPL